MLAHACVQVVLAAEQLDRTGQSRQLLTGAARALLPVRCQLHPRPLALTRSAAPPYAVRPRPSAGSAIADIEQLCDPRRASATRPRASGSARRAARPVASGSAMAPDGRGGPSARARCSRSRAELAGSPPGGGLRRGRCCRSRVGGPDRWPCSPSSRRPPGSGARWWGCPPSGCSPPPSSASTPDGWRWFRSRCGLAGGRRRPGRRGRRRRPAPAVRAASRPDPAPSPPGCVSVVRLVVAGRLAGCRDGARTVQSRWHGLGSGAWSAGRYELEVESRGAVRRPSAPRPAAAGRRRARPNGSRAVPSRRPREAVPGASGPVRTAVVWCPDWPVTAAGYGPDVPAAASARTGSWRARRPPAPRGYAAVTGAARRRPAARARRARSRARPRRPRVRAGRHGGRGVGAGRRDRAPGGPGAPGARAGALLRRGRAGRGSCSPPRRARLLGIGAPTSASGSPTGCSPRCSLARSSVVVPAGGARHSLRPRTSPRCSWPAPPAPGEPATRSSTCCAGWACAPSARSPRSPSTMSPPASTPAGRSPIGWPAALIPRRCPAGRSRSTSR